MTVRELLRGKKNIKNWDEVEIRDEATDKLLYRGCASAAMFEDQVKDWRYPDGRVIYI